MDTIPVPDEEESEESNTTGNETNQEREGQECETSDSTQASTSSKAKRGPPFIQFGDMLLMIPMHFPKATQTMPFAKIAISQ